MNPLSKDAQSVVDAARENEHPTDDDRRRVKAKLLLAVAGGSAVAAGVASTAGGASTAGTGAAAGAGAAASSASAAGAGAAASTAGTGAVAGAGAVAGTAAVAGTSAAAGVGSTLLVGGTAIKVLAVIGVAAAATTAVVSYQDEPQVNAGEVAASSETRSRPGLNTPGTDQVAKVPGDAVVVAVPEIPKPVADVRAESDQDAPVGPVPETPQAPARHGPKLTAPRDPARHGPKVAAPRNTAPEQAAKNANKHVTKNANKVVVEPTKAIRTNSNRPSSRAPNKTSKKTSKKTSGAASGAASPPARHPQPTRPQPPANDMKLMQAAIAAEQRGDYQPALGLVRRHRTEFSSSPLAEERLALHIALLCRLDRQSEARLLQDEFQSKYGASYLADRIKLACEPSR